MREAWMSAMRCIFSAGLEGKLPFWPLIGVTVLDGEYAVAMSRWFESAVSSGERTRTPAARCERNETS